MTSFVNWILPHHAVKEVWKMSPIRRWWNPFQLLHNSTLRGRSEFPKCVEGNLFTKSAEISTNRLVESQSVPNALVRQRTLIIQLILSRKVVSIYLLKLCTSYLMLYWLFTRVKYENCNARPSVMWFIEAKSLLFGSIFAWMPSAKAIWLLLRHCYSSLHDVRRHWCIFSSLRAYFEDLFFGISSLDDLLQKWEGYSWW